jgi:hypothetical protein
VLPNLISLAVILGAVTIGVLASLLSDKHSADSEQREHGPDPAEPS